MLDHLRLAPAGVRQYRVILQRWCRGTWRLSVAAVLGWSISAHAGTFGPLASANSDATLRSTQGAPVAEDAPSAPQTLDPQSTSLPASPRYIVDVHSDWPRVTTEEVRRAIAAELGAEVFSAPPNALPDGTAGADGASTPVGVITVTLRSETNELTVSYSQPGRGVIVRVVAAPPTAEDVILTAAFLAGNLARDEASQLLDGNPAQAPAADAPALPTATSSPITQPQPQTEAPALAHAETPLASNAASTPATASFFYPLATNFDQPEVETYLQFNVLHGRVGSLDGLGVGGVSVVTGSARGVQLASLVNFTGTQTEGLQIAGLTNLSGMQVVGAQVSFGLNRAGGLQGAQLAGLLNVSTANTRGLQGSLLLNHAANFEGVQLGLVNIAKKVHGVQLGLVNFADDIEGLPIGLVSVTRSGGIHPLVWSSNTTYGNVGLKFATRYTYSMFSLNLHASGAHSIVGPGVALGVSVPLFPHLSFETDVGGAHLFGHCCRAFESKEARQYDRTQLKLRGMFRVPIQDHFSVVAGGGLTAELTYGLDQNDVVHRDVNFPGEYFAGLQF